VSGAQVVDAGAVKADVELAVAEASTDGASGLIHGAETAHALAHEAAASRNLRVVLDVERALARVHVGDVPVPENPEAGVVFHRERADAAFVADGEPRVDRHGGGLRERDRASGVVVPADVNAPAGV